MPCPDCSALKAEVETLKKENERLKNEKDQAVDDVAAFCIPDLSKCSPACGDLMPNAKEAFGYFLSFEWISMAETGEKDFVQNPCYNCWFNMPLCLGTVCVPFCALATGLRVMEKTSGKSCESGCLSCCVLSQCCCLWSCYAAKQRTEFRKKYKIKGTGCWDCCGACCGCGLCMLCQDANQLMEQGELKVPFCSLAEAKAMSAKVTPLVTPKDK